MAKQTKPNVNLLSTDEVKRYEMLYPMINSDLSEVRELSKKKQDEPLNKFKVKTINQKLRQVKELLKNEPTHEFLELLDEDTFPSNSDAVLMISHFIKAMDQFRIRYYTTDGSEFGFYKKYNSWKTKE